MWKNHSVIYSFRADYTRENPEKVRKKSETENKKTETDPRAGPDIFEENLEFDLKKREFMLF